MFTGEERHVLATPIVRQFVLAFPNDRAGFAVDREDFIVLREINHAIFSPPVFRLTHPLRLKADQSQKITAGDNFQFPPPLMIVSLNINRLAMTNNEFALIQFFARGKTNFLRFLAASQ